jgi:hypothetical protein
MFNPLLKALANTGTFQHPAFQAPDSLSPWSFSSGMLDLRRRLMLESEEREYYLMVYLALLQAFPELQELLPDEPRTYRLEDITCQDRLRITGASLAGIPNRVGRFLHYEPTQLPINLDYDLSWHSDTTCKIVARQRQAVGIFTCRAYELNGDWMLDPVWTADLPFEGVLKLEAPWVAGTTVHLHAEPGLFPMQALLTRLQQSPYLQGLLVEFNLAADFQSAFDPYEQVALVLTAVALANKSVYPDAAITPARITVEEDQLLEKVTPAPPAEFFFRSDFGYATGENSSVYAVNGVTDTATGHVNRLLRTLDPQQQHYLIGGGDNAQAGASVTLESFDSRIADAVGLYMYPYRGTRTGGHPSQQNHFITVLGNHDMATEGVTPNYTYSATQRYDPRADLAMWYLNIPNWYYSWRQGNTEFFMLTAGVNSSNHDILPGGNTKTGAQYHWLQAATARSNARWKIVVLHDPPYSSGSGHRDYTELRYDYHELGVDLVLSGHDHHYEVLRAHGLHYVVCGIGGSPNSGLRTSANATSTLISPYSGPSPHQVYKLGNVHGLLRLQPGQTELVTTLVDVWGRNRHTLRIHKA